MIPFFKIFLAYKNTYFIAMENTLLICFSLFQFVDWRVIIGNNLLLFFNLLLISQRKQLLQIIVYLNECIKRTLWHRRPLQNNESKNIKNNIKIHFPFQWKIRYALFRFLPNFWLTRSFTSVLEWQSFLAMAILWMYSRICCARY